MKIFFTLLKRIYVLKGELVYKYDIIENSTDEFACFKIVEFDSQKLV